MDVFGVWIERSRLDGNRAMSGAALAVVTDAFGGRGSIVQYNRDFLFALAERDLMSSIDMMRRPLDSMNCVTSGRNLGVSPQPL